MHKILASPKVKAVTEVALLEIKGDKFVKSIVYKNNKTGKTIIFTTHHLDLIDHLQPRVAVLSEDHTIQKTGSASEILNDEEFLISVNLIHEHIHKHCISISSSS